MSEFDLFEGRDGGDSEPRDDGPVAGAPLAARMRPRTLDDYVGQQHLLAPGRALRELIERMEASRDELLPRIRRAKDTASNREALNHFVGIERWSQSRIAVAKGEPLELDSYHGYRLPDTASLEELQDAFAQTREDSIALARELDAAGIDVERKVPHNDLGELSVLEWFAYLDDHSRREIIRIREGQEP